MENLKKKGKIDFAEKLKLSEEKIGLYKLKPRQNSGQIDPLKIEAKAELRKLIEKSSGSLVTKGKPYLEWMERVPFPTRYKRPDLLVFKGTSPAK